ncbi:MAG: haloacid dehalogenase [Deltaproteobacteria bacterium]|nr:haloacid dehalogenase [Deltaproteobacteria bacterium]
MKIDPNKAAFDIDGVMADTMTLFLKIARRDFGINDIRYEDITEYYLEDCLDIDPDIIGVVINRMIEGNSGIDLMPMDGAVSILSRVGAVAPLLFVTARPRLEPIERWVRKTLPLDPSRMEVIATGSFEGKVEILKTRGIAYFVEDRLETCFHLHENDIIPILFSHPWNQKPHPFHSVRNWTEIEELFDLQRQASKFGTQ